MSTYRDDDDWVGTPPEGRHARERAKPEHWRAQQFLAPTAAMMVVLAIVLVLVIVL